MRLKPRRYTKRSFTKVVDSMIYDKNIHGRDWDYIAIIGHIEKLLSKENMDIDFDKLKFSVGDNSTAINKYLNSLIKDIDPNVLKRTFVNFGYNAMVKGTKSIHHLRKVQKANIPWLIFIDPTTECNLHCSGCWSSSYEYKTQKFLSFEELSHIIKQGKELGIYFYAFTGGEPLLRQDAIIRLCEENNDCQFLVYTNGTLIQDSFCREVKRLGNLMVAFSLEASEIDHDRKRGVGTYKHVLDSMEKMKNFGLLYGCSINYTSENYLKVIDKDFVKDLVNKGCKFATYFHYMPIKKDSSVDLILKPEQRKHVIKRIRQIRDVKNGEGLLTLDFPHDETFLRGCAGGGKNYIHINSKGDVEPCIFIHYSDSNIRDYTLLECLKRPLCNSFYKKIPFDKNLLKSCPILDCPADLEKILTNNTVESTEDMDPITPDLLSKKCMSSSLEWAKVADEMWEDILYDYSEEEDI